MNSKRQVKRKSGHAIQIDDCRSHETYLLLTKLLMLSINFVLTAGYLEHLLANSALKIFLPIPRSKRRVLVFCFVFVLFCFFFLALPQEGFPENSNFLLS